MKFLLILSLVIFILPGCTSIARVSNFETQASDIDFQYLAGSHDSSAGAIWTWKGKNEFFLYLRPTDIVTLREQLMLSLDEFGYSLTSNLTPADALSSEDGLALVADRGIRMNEWGSVAGVYAAVSNTGYYVYIKVEITQDITGGWASNRAKAIGEYFCRISQLCITP